jgi:hypothetical protein
VHLCKHGEECGSLQEYHRLSTREVCLLNHDIPTSSVIFVYDLKLMSHTAQFYDQCIIPEKRLGIMWCTTEVTESEIAHWFLMGLKSQNPLA